MQNNAEMTKFSGLLMGDDWKLKFDPEADAANIDFMLNFTNLTVIDVDSNGMFLRVCVLKLYHERICDMKDMVCKLNDSTTSCFCHVSYGARVRSRSPGVQPPGEYRPQEWNEEEHLDQLHLRNVCLGAFRAVAQVVAT